MPQHQHLFAENGCFQKGQNSHKKCGTGRGGEKETPLPPEFLPLLLTAEMDQAWDELIKGISILTRRNKYCIVEAVGREGRTCGEKR